MVFRSFRTFFSRRFSWSSCFIFHPHCGLARRLDPVQVSLLGHDANKPDPVDFHFAINGFLAKHPDEILSVRADPGDVAVPPDHGPTLAFSPRSTIITSCIISSLLSDASYNWSRAQPDIARRLWSAAGKIEPVEILFSPATGYQTSSNNHYRQILLS